jgi:hypothetical protein
MSTLKVTTLDTCTTIRDSASNTRITLAATSPQVALANQTDVIRALNTAKCWGSIYGGTNNLGQTYNVSSWQDIGSNQRRVNFTVAFSNNQYAVSGYTAQGDGIAQDNLTCIGNKNASFFQMSSNNQTGGYNPEAFTNAGWVVFANNGGA